VTDRPEDLASRLDDIAEALSEMAIASLQSAVARGEARRPADERRFTQARRAVEKAAHLLRSTEGEPE
jgi:hypothetical protein